MTDKELRERLEVYIRIWLSDDDEQKRAHALKGAIETTKQIQNKTEYEQRLSKQ